MKIYFLSFFTAVMLLLPSATKAQTYDPTYGWFDTEDFISNNCSGSITGGLMMLLPDSGACWIDKKGEKNPVDIYTVGHVFDVAHKLWAAVPSPLNQSIIPVRLNCPFTWDSLQFYYYYNRQHPDTSIVDTVLIYYYHNFTNTMLNAYTIDIEECIPLVAYPQSVNSSTLSGNKYFRVDTMLLTAAYQPQFNSSKLNLFKTAINLSFTPNPLAVHPNFDRLLGFNMVFKPGYKVNMGDTLFTYKDSFETKTNIFGGHFTSVYWYGGNVNVYICYCNDEYVNNSIFFGNKIPHTLYKDSSGFIPSQAFSLPRYLWSGVHITSTSCPLSINQPTNTKVTFTKNISPNPVATSSTVTVEVNTSTNTQLKVQLRDVLGNLLFETSPKIVEGEKTFKLNTPQNRGLYFVVLVDDRTNAVLATEKLLVTE